MSEEEFDGMQPKKSSVVGSKDEMDQWVSDSFYSYFPGFTDEYQKRQDYLRNPQHENQQNLLRHQKLQISLTKPPADVSTLSPRNQIDSSLNNTYSQSSINLSSQSASIPNSKNDLEIIVTNPNYQPSKYIFSRPNTNRHKKLENLRHTALSSTEDVYTNRYKGPRRLEEKLRTIDLEEKLAKKNILNKKIQKYTEKNRLMKAQFLAKMENDTIMFCEKTNYPEAEIKEENGDVKNAKSSGGTDINKNKVYKYFSNSARHKHEKDVCLNLDPSDRYMEEKECFHLSEKVCPKCDAPLKIYQRFCLNCQQLLRTKYMVSRAPKKEEKENIYSDEMSESMHSFDEKSKEDGSVDCVLRDQSLPAANGKEKYADSSVLACHKCARMYTLCNLCVTKNAVCRACHRKLNVCMSCRRNLCNFCLNEIATGHNTERTHRNDTQLSKESEETYLNPSDQREHSFYVLEVTPTTLENHRADCIKSAFNSMDHEKYSGCHHVKTDFHTLSKSEKSFENIDKSFYFGNDENVSIDNVRRTVDKKLYQYLKNYNEEERNKNESRHRGTQSNNENMNRRDIMLHEEHNLSIPLLQEMPKMTRLEYINYAKLSTKQRKRKLDCLEQKCQLIFQIPDIQTCNMTQNLPLMVTQVGAIRKQLQTDHLPSDTQ
ncbi:LOW QUALITY PROTEIN: uncharacterized protein LOC128864721 [Anastrepha ludens]|uniref:LOW QUALITY PROTEIN: uncharacterized protein LOC128864721 n=1 Tax=Anastrepha ludens TaxID=28586 RepID=UPI0023B1D736|nr:LOW QUALITY PROTEIN: uncharacterized protein LOC128864721 [Anastrepha ludens]